MAHSLKPHIRKVSLLFFPLVLLTTLLANCAGHRDWRTASRDSAGIAPSPDDAPEAIVHVYGASAWGWRGWFAIHTWIATKRTDADSYVVYEVIGWREHHGRPVLRIARDLPDRFWFGEQPELLKEHRGNGVEEMIDAIERAAASYPWKMTYTVFPGPNSNTFTAWVAKEVPELELRLPFSAIGSGYVN